MARRANHEGTVYRRKDGRWEGAAYAPTTSGVYKRMRVYGRTRQEAHDKLIVAQMQVQQGIPMPDKSWKLAEYLDYWLEKVVRPNQRPATYARAETMVRLHLKPGLGRYTLTRLSVRTVQTFLDQQRDTGRPPATLHTIRKTLSAALTWAMRQELLFRNVARLVTLATYKPVEAKPWTVDETRRFLEAARDESLYAAFVLLIQYGLRRGEVLGLRWSDVDSEYGVLHVRQQLQRVGSELRLGGLKTDAGRRDAPLTQVAIDVLRAQRTRQTAARHEAGETWEGPGTEEEFVFTTRTGRPVEPRNLFRSFQRICADHGLRRIRLHDLRHGNATVQMNLGVPDKHIQAILGHADVTTTRRLYEHSDLENQRQALEQVEQALWSSDGTSRCRQSSNFQPSNDHFVAQNTTFQSGAVFGIRTRDPFLTMPLQEGVFDRVTEVNEFLKVHGRHWLIGCVAVNFSRQQLHARHVHKLGRQTGVPSSLLHKSRTSPSARRRTDRNFLGSYHV